MITDTLTLQGDIETFSPKERAMRIQYIELVSKGEIEPPHLEWLQDYGDGVSGDALSRIATSVYNNIVQAREQDVAPSCPCGGFADILESGLDAELWTLIRIGLEAAPTEDLIAVCERRGYEVNRTSLTEIEGPQQAH